MATNQTIKDRILTELNSLSESEQETVLGFVENCQQGKEDETEWEEMPDVWKKRIQQSIDEAEKGNFIANEDAVSYIRKKFGLNA